MSFGFSVFNVESVNIGSCCDLGAGQKSFRLAFRTKCDFYGENVAEVIVFANAGFVSKMERIAASIRTIMAEPDAEPVALTDSAEAARDALVLAVPDVGFGNDRALVTMENLRRAGWKLTEAGNVAVIAPAISEAAE